MLNQLRVGINREMFISYMKKSCFFFFILHVLIPFYHISRKINELKKYLDYYQNTSFVYVCFIVDNIVESNVFKQSVQKNKIIITYL
jgi:hypothetical protein